MRGAASRSMPQVILHRGGLPRYLRIADGVGRKLVETPDFSSETAKIVFVVVVLNLPKLVHDGWAIPVNESVLDPFSFLLCCGT
jgi:hypothetical protein